MTTLRYCFNCFLFFLLCWCFQVRVLPWQPRRDAAPHHQSHRAPRLGNTQRWCWGGCGDPGGAQALGMGTRSHGAAWDPGWGHPLISPLRFQVNSTKACAEPLGDLSQLQDCRVFVQIINKM